MAKRIYIDGTIVATTGNLFTRDCICGCEVIPPDCEVYQPPGGVWEVTRPSGSMFDTYYSRGDAVATDIETGNIFAFKSIYSFTVRDYQSDMDRLRSMMGVEMPSNLINLFNQQQLVSAFSLLESFLGSSFLRETCDREDAYHRVWSSGCLSRHIKGTRNKEVAKGPDCIEKEVLYIESVNQLIYHNSGKVHDLFQVAFGIDVCLAPLEKELVKRHDIVHRYGRNKRGENISVSRAELVMLLDDIDAVVQHTAEQIIGLPSMEEETEITY